MKHLSPEAQAQVIEQWKARHRVTGRAYVPVNNGARRTASKRALLRAIQESARKRGRLARFQAKI